MIKFNECRITADGKRLVIDVSVIDSVAFENVYIDAITIDTDKTFVEDGPSDRPVFHITSEQMERYEENNTGVRFDDDDTYSLSDSGHKRMRLSLLRNDPRLNADFDKDMFFVYVHTKGSPSTGVPCQIENSGKVGVAVNMYWIYRATMSFISQIDERCCGIPDMFVDMIIRTKALRLAINTGSHTRAIKIWQSLFTGRHTNRSSSKCGCHGR